MHDSEHPVRGRPASRRPAWRVAAAAIVAAAAFAGASATAGAVTCDYAQSGHFLEVRIQDSHRIVVMDLSGDTIRIFDYITPVTCTSNPPALTPTVTNTDVIAIAAETFVVATSLTIDDAPGFVPGATPEPNGGTSEIEIFVNLRDPVGSRLSVRSGAFPGSIRFGASGINTNAVAGEILPDADITLQNVGPVEGKSGNTTATGLDASGGAGTGAALSDAIYLVGSNVADVLVGGGGGDELFAAAGSDALRGGIGDDELKPGLGEDTIEGGPGTDVVDYLFATTTGIVVDLERSGPQPTGGAGTDSIESVEDIRGTQFTDLLSGDGGPNSIFSSSGEDFLDGRGGPDAITAGAGADTIQARDGVRDVIDCGDDTDAVTADAPGVDALTGCEDVTFPPTAPTGGAGGATGGAGSGGGAVAQTPPRLRSLLVAPRAFDALRSGPSARAVGRRVAGALVAFGIDRAAAVTFRVVRRAAGRKAAGRCVAPARAPGGGRRCTRIVPVAGSFARSAPAGLARFSFTGRIGRRALAPGTYELRAVPKAAGLTGATARATFRITARRAR
jgi:Ca2+-binding RTX toxin-like protein